MAAKAMKKAWEIFKKWGVRTMEAWSTALRKAWAIVKGLIKEEVQKMVELKGTPKQIKWAEDIRARVIPVVEKVAAATKERILASYTERYGAEMAQERKEQLDEAVQLLINETSASVWIDRFGYDKEDNVIASKAAFYLKDICREKKFSGRIADIFHRVAVEMYI